MTLIVNSKKCFQNPLKVFLAQQQTNRSALKKYFSERMTISFGTSLTEQRCFARALRVARFIRQVNETFRRAITR